MPRMAVKIRQWTFLILGTAGWLCAHAAGDAPLVTTYTSSEIGMEAVSWIARQDAKSTLYFGGQEVITFDGDRWLHHPVPDAYAVYGLALGGNGKLWVGALGNLGWFDCAASDGWQFHSLLPMVSSRLQPLGQIWYTFAEGDGAVFVTVDRILRWNGTTFQTWLLPNTRRLPTMQGADGVIYIYYERQGLLALRQNGPEIVIPRSILGDAAILWLEQQGTDWLLGTHLGLYRYRDGRLEPFAPVVSDILRQSVFTGGARLADGRYAFGTMLAGIVVMSPDGTLERTLRETEGLPTHAIFSMLVDQGGSLWVTSGSSIFRLDLSSPSTVFDREAGLPPHAYDTLTRFQDKIFAGSENGVYELSADHRRFEPTLSLPESVHEIRGTSLGLVVAGRRSARNYDGQSAESFYTTKNDTFSIGLARQSPAHVYLADNNSIVWAGPGTESKTVVHRLPDFARSIVEDPAGDLWLGTVTSGVLRARPSPRAPVEAASVSGTMGLPQLEGRGVVRATVDGSILIFADNGAWFRPAGHELFTAIKDYPSRGIRAASEFAPDDTAWVVHDSHGNASPVVARVRVDGDGAQWQAHSIPELARIGAPRSIFTETDSTGATVLWIGGTKSILRHIVARGPLAPQPPPPLLRALAQDAKSAAWRPFTTALPYATPSIAFEFSVPDFLRRDSLRVESRIGGVDQEWIVAGRDSRRELSAPRDGKYVLAVRTVADTGVKSDPTLFRFEVLPPFWRTMPFAVAVGLMLMPLAYGAFRLRVRALRRRNSQLESKVRERTEELVAANAAKTQFVANMSHDIRNPLNGIVGLTFALEDSRLDPRQREVVATLRECTTYLSSLVDDVLDFASIEAGRVELRPAPFVPAELLRSIVETLKRDATESGARLSIEIADDVPAHLSGDAGRIQQILVNFVSNGLKYAGGPIRLSVGLPADLPGEVEFAVIDQGPGLSEAECATLFTKFSRLRQQRGGEEIPGTGLGLASCRLLADLMGGSVGVDSKVGGGARFFLRLPLTIATAPVKPDTQHLPNTTVLVVEDQDYNAWAAAAVLARLGLTSERACNGAEALELFARKRYNVVLLDRNLPDMDGLDVARRMREFASDGQPSVLLAITAYCTAADRARCLEAGMDGFVGKPLTPDKLRKALLGVGNRLQTAVSVQAPVEAAPPELDLQLLNYLSDGTAEGLAQQVERFLASLQTGQRELEHAGRDFERLSRGAHQLYGQAKMINAAELVQAAYDLEMAAREGNEQDADRNLQRVAEETHRVTAAMRRRLRAHSA